MDMLILAGIASLAMFANPIAHIDSNRSEFMCLATGIYFETKGSSYAGKIASGLVIRNRVNHPSWPNTYCKVLSQPGMFHYKQKDIRAIVTKAKLEPNEWKEAVISASLIMGNKVDDYTKGATFFCNPKTSKANWCRVSKPSLILEGHKYITPEEYRTK